MEIDGVVYDDPRWMLLADLNNDGWLDLVVPQISADHSFVLWGGPDGFRMDRAQLFPVVCCVSAQAADLTGNGWLDLIFGGYMGPSEKYLYDSYLYIYWGGPDGFREDRRAQLPAHAANALAVADFNNDGILDIFACSYHAGKARDIDSYIYWGRPGGLYSAAHHTRLFTHSASGCIAADFNEDGWIDLAVANHKTYGCHPGQSCVWWNGPQGFSEERVTLLPTLGPHGMVAVNPGNILDRGPEEYYTSSPFELPAGARVQSISWEVEVPPKTWVRAQLRFAEQAEGLDAAPWQGPGGGNGWLERGDSTEGLRQTGPWVQYRLALGAVNGGNSPRVTEVSVRYGP
jgi:hypothetical protein